MQSLGIIVWAPHEIPGASSDHLNQLLIQDPDSWSGITVREGNLIAIIVNSAHSEERQASTMMHEWAHIELRHKPNRVDRSEHGLFLLSDYPSDVEDEADWLAAAVLLPREGLLRHRSRGMSSNEIAKHYAVSIDLTNWRLRMTGVDRQLRQR
ncbi:ImmA/IrrE family metallo-endopeptidase [Pyruvatibacter mobilis]|uniref:ImmA/IrrE family metallo-endopeptidase n=1 Tax=Pyruvatibacter mobilis TaxID=1712261 RepID=UPI003C7B88FC